MNEVENRHMKQRIVMRGLLEGWGFYVALKALELILALEKGTRKDGLTPKAHHQLSVGRLLSTLVPHLLYPEETLAAAFLHDILEDHPDEWDHDKLVTEFGEIIADAVWRLSKKSGGMSKDYPSYFAGMTECPIASLVKLADRAHNLQTMQGVFTYEKQALYVAEVDKWFLPMVRAARKRHPRQRPAFENLKILLLCQMRLIRHIHAAAESTQPADKHKWEPSSNPLSVKRGECGKCGATHT